jgi:hypothetical protein
MLTLTYHDAYLAPLIAKTPDWESRAMADVAQLGAFPTLWTNKLVVLRAYILCCLESNAAEDDVFSVKLKQYQAEWKDVYAAAKVAANLAETKPAVSITIPYERG